MALVTLSLSERNALQSLINTCNAARLALYENATLIAEQWREDLDQKTLDSPAWADHKAGRQGKVRLDALDAWIEQNLPDNPLRLPAELDL